MTQEYTPSIETIIDVYVTDRVNAMQIQLSDEWARERKRIVKQAMGALAAHDAQIRAEAWDFANAKQTDNGEELLNEALSEAVEEYLLYGAHPLSTEEDSDDIWDDAELFNLKLTNGDVLSTVRNFADEVLDALKRYLKGQPMLQSIPVKEQKQ